MSNKKNNKGAETEAQQPVVEQPTQEVAVPQTEQPAQEQGVPEKEQPAPKTGKTEKRPAKSGALTAVGKAACKRHKLPQVWGTNDGQAFANENDVKAHAKNLPNSETIKVTA